MPIFRYKAVKDTGQVISGELEASSLDAALAHLQGEGHFPLKAVLAGQSLIGRLREYDLRRRVGLDEAVAIAMRELSTLLSAGLPLSRALTILLSLTPREQLHSALMKVRAEVAAGSRLADAIETARLSLPRVALGMIRAGESGGSLEVALERLSDYLDRAIALRESIKSALVYPILLLATAGLSLTFVLTYVLPQFKPFFAEAGQSLPLPTRVVMVLGDLVSHWGWAIILVVIAAGLYLRHSLQNPSLRRRWDSRLLELPLFGDLISKIQAARFARILGTVLKSGVTLPAGLVMASQSIDNAAVAAEIAEAAVNVREGESLSSLLAQIKSLPPLVAQLVEIGEESGRLEDMLFQEAELFEREVKRTIDRLMAALVPLLTIILGLIVAGIVASILLAILKVNELAA